MRLYDRAYCLTFSVVDPEVRDIDHAYYPGGFQSPHVTHNLQTCSLYHGGR